MAIHNAMNNVLDNQTSLFLCVCFYNREAQFEIYFDSVRSSESENGGGHREVIAVPRLFLLLRLVLRGRKYGRGAMS